MRAIVPSAFALLAFACPCAFAQPAPEEAPPADFTRFDIEGHQDVADALNAYTWHHFKNRGGNGLTLFNKEYLLLADMWLNAKEPGSGRPIQEVHRDELLNIQLNEEGYVNTHQHYSHAHDEGWPFPVWPQAGMGPGEFEGITAGWLFQEKPDLQGWAAGYLQQKPELEKYYGTKAAESWKVWGDNLGIVDKAWQVKGPAGQPAEVLNFSITTPEGVSLDAFNCPYLQIRWKCSSPLAPGADCYVGWTSDSLSDDLTDRRRFFHFAPQSPAPDGYFHTLLPLYTNDRWRGKITSLSIFFPINGGTYSIDSIFTCYDTRHTINNPIFILASKIYFDWTNDLDFLRKQINRMRTALLYMRNSMKGAERDYIRVEWPGHDGIAGFKINSDGTKTHNPGHGIGNKYWDLMPFGWDDFYATYQYYAATVAMAEIEEQIQKNPQWNIPAGALAIDPLALRVHAKAIKAKANELFWNDTTGRYIACIDQEGVPHDYGYTFLNLEAIWYGIVPADRARTIMDWISGKRIVEGDTSTGEDIYHWRFGPRATTKRNIDWYGQGWFNPETIPWGGQIQDGGAVLGFTFYDLWARRQVYGKRNAWKRLQEIMAWDREVMAAGGYRAYYADGSKGTTLQGCGTPGGIGIDCEFYESSLLSAFAILGLAGVRPDKDFISADGSCGLPDEVPAMHIYNLSHHGINADVTVKSSGGSYTVPAGSVVTEAP